MQDNDVGGTGVASRTEGWTPYSAPKNISILVT